MALKSLNTHKIVLYFHFGSFKSVSYKSNMMHFKVESLPFFFSPPSCPSLHPPTRPSLSPLPSPLLCFLHSFFPSFFSFGFLPSVFRMVGINAVSLKGVACKHFSLFCIYCDFWKQVSAFTVG